MCCKLEETKRWADGSFSKSCSKDACGVHGFYPLSLTRQEDGGNLSSVWAEFEMLTLRV